MSISFINVIRFHDSDLHVSFDPFSRMFPVSVRRLPPEPGGHISSYENLNMSAYDSLDLPSYRLSGERHLKSLTVFLIFEIRLCIMWI